MATTLFKLFTVFCSLMVINARNPVYAVISLILVFINSAGLLLYFGAEFLGMVFLVVYIGAIAVLFLFVIMMINIRYVELTAKELFYLPLNGLFLILPLSMEVASYAYLQSSVSFYPDYTFLSTVTQAAFSSTNMEVLGFLLYSSRYTWIVFLSALILLVAMVGAIALTLTKRFDVRRQSIFSQLSRPIERSFRLADSEKQNSN